MWPNNRIVSAYMKHGLVRLEHKTVEHVKCFRYVHPRAICRFLVLAPIENSPAFVGSVGDVGLTFGQSAIFNADLAVVVSADFDDVGRWIEVTTIHGFSLQHRAISRSCENFHTQPRQCLFLLLSFRKGQGCVEQIGNQEGLTHAVHVVVLDPLYQSLVKIACG
jgi:hypothetical protein